MATRVFLHVGAPKTGTSYLQQVLWANRTRLLDAGWLLPGTRAAHYQAMGDLRRGYWHDPFDTWTWDRLAQAARDHRGPVIVSEEMLGAATEEQAARAVASLAPAEVHVVVAGRDLWRTIPSSWQQAIRARGIGRFTDYVASLRSGRNPAFWNHQTPLPILRRWCDGLPPEHRHLVTVPPPGAPRELLWKRFAAALGLPEGLCSTDLEHADHNPGNVSLGAGETELLRRVNIALGDEFPLRVPYLRAVRRRLVLPVLMRRPAPARFGLPVELSDWAAEAAEKMVAELRTYPCEVEGDLDDLLPSGMRASTAPDDLSDSELLQVAVETIVGLVRHADELAAQLPPEPGPAPRTGLRRLRRAPAKLARIARSAVVRRHGT